MASVFALFSTLCNTAVRARRIPSNPCNGVRVSFGGYDAERQVATPAQVLRAAMRLHHTAGYAGFVLCLLNAYTGARPIDTAGISTSSVGMETMRAGSSGIRQRSTVTCPQDPHGGADDDVAANEAEYADE
ncbi:hypothetical protein F4561_003675 [Lipingzhangella halophila]|uniref:Uncharacterized protein n=1 Tax=Lipingzhangella halophila TaxID=1783352 RepID=A0A7W7RJ32_9ACTN|nr:hypothetical protein [Lipingzhangella halophila]MBB4932855.1 hypothetical protein [Lipingzhangella halophila]